MIQSIHNQSFSSKKVKNNKKQFDSQKNARRVAIGSVIGSAAGIAGSVIGVYAMSKGKNPSVKLSNLKYNETDALLIGAGSVVGGLLGGLATDKDKKNAKFKLREASQQFIGNMLFPLGTLAIGNSILEKTKFSLPKIKSSSKTALVANKALAVLPKVGMILTALIGGMEVGNKFMNKVNNKIFKEEVKHDIEAEDYLVHADDIMLAANMLLKDAKAVSNVTSKILPATFIVAGSKTGMQKA